MLSRCSSVMAKGGLSFHFLELILQPGSDGELEVDHYEIGNGSVEDEAFAEDVPKSIVIQSMRPG